MQTTTVEAPDSRMALDLVDRQLGPGAVVLSTRRTARGIEVTAGCHVATERSQPRPAPWRHGPALRVVAPSVASSHAHTPGATSAAVPESLSAMAARLSDEGPRARFLKQASGIGFDRATAEQLLGHGDKAGSASLGDCWAHFIRAMEKRLVTQTDFDRRYRHLCVVGQQGSGKTTLLIQLAASLRRAARDRHIRLLSADNARPGAVEELHVYGRVLGMPVTMVSTAQDMVAVLAEADPHERILIDMPSDPAVASAYLSAVRRASAAEEPGVIMTIPVTAQAAAHDRIATCFSGYAKATALSFANEQLPPGGALSALLRGGLPLAYISRSNDLLDGLEPARASKLCAMTLAALTRAAPRREA